MHRAWVENVPERAGEAVVEGEEARHALRVKRVRAGEPIEVLDGRGRIGAGVLAEPEEGGKKAAMGGSLVASGRSASCRSRRGRGWRCGRRWPRAGASMR